MAAKPLRFLYFSTYEWDDRWRRKQRLAHELARHEGVSLLYVEPPTADSLLDWARGSFSPSHLPPRRSERGEALLGTARRVGERAWAMTVTEKVLPLGRWSKLRKMPWLRRLNRTYQVARLRAALKRLPPGDLVLWLTHPLQRWALAAFPERRLACYDWTDDWAAFEVLPVADRAHLERENEALLREVDLVFAVSKSLCARAKALNPQTWELPNATDLAVIGRAAVEGPIEGAVAALPQPRIGYVGQIADKLDYALIGRLAELRPAWSFIFVGNVWENHREEVEALAAHPNLHFLGRRAYAELPDILRGFDLCLLPHRLTPLTESMDPIKLYDYLATGKPIVGTPVAGMERFADVVYTGRTAEELVAQMEVAFREPPALRERRLAYAHQATWERRGEEAYHIIHNQIEGT